MTADNSVRRVLERSVRVVCLFEAELGPMAIIVVGAMIVASVEVPWAGLITPVKKQVRSWYYPSIKNSATDHNSFAPTHLEKDEEMGRFKRGSTAIVLLGDNGMEWDSKRTSQSTV